MIYSKYAYLKTLNVNADSVVEFVTQHCHAAIKEWAEMTTH